jgi:hypothetical protein
LFKYNTYNVKKDFAGNLKNKNPLKILIYFDSGIKSLKIIPARSKRPCRIFR